MKEDLSNISRIDQEPRAKNRAGQHGWWVRVKRGGKQFQHFFNDAKYENREKALEAAFVFRDAVRTNFPETPQIDAMLSGTTSLSQRNTSGVLGVNRSAHEYTKDGKKYARLVWQAHWPLGNGRYQNRAFSIHKHGEEGAFRLAVKARQEGLARLTPTKHPAFAPPGDTRQRIWRYMDFTKFVSMLEDSSLFFSCVAMLNDPFEGSLSKLNRVLRPLIYKQEQPKSLPNIAMTLRNEVAVNCWHTNDYESAAMWELYSKSDEAVCVQSTYEKLSEALGGRAEIGAVQYADYENEYIPEHDPYLAFLYKRRSFEHEREIRAIVRDLDHEHQGRGMFIEVDLNVLVEAVYVFPNSPDWLFELVKKTMKRHVLDKPAIRSSLADDPVY